MKESEEKHTGSNPDKIKEGTPQQPRTNREAGIGSDSDFTKGNDPAENAAKQEQFGEDMRGSKFAEGLENDPDFSPGNDASIRNTQPAQGKDAGYNGSKTHGGLDDDDKTDE